MSEPKTDYEDKLVGARLELVAAQSALNMEPAPIPLHEQRGRFLVHVDGWAEHAHEHIIAAMQLLAEEEERR